VSPEARTVLATVLAALLLLPAAALPWYPKIRGESTLAESKAGQVVGRYFSRPVREGETLVQLAREYGLGYGAMIHANPDIDPWLPKKGQPVLFPYSTILPEPPRPGIVVNLAELRLFLFWREKGNWRVRIYPVGIGDQGWETPTGEFSIRQVVERPSWTPPPSLRQEHPELPPVVPPGPDNPLGGYWLGFSPEGFGLHGTNAPFGIGRRVSHGCIRLYPEDIRDLAKRAVKGTPIRIVYRPIKVGIRDDILYVESHYDFLGKIADSLQEIVSRARAAGWTTPLPAAVVEKILVENRGIPVPVARRPSKKGFLNRQALNE
jgi:L,D-transpeptidase ErfK/SrfK